MHFQQLYGALCMVGLGLVCCNAAWAQADREIEFDQDVHPILAENCYDCHGGGKSKGELSLESREAVLEGGFSGPVVVEGNSAESLLIRVVSGLEEGLQMPPKGDPLSEADIDTLRRWIDQGLPWGMTAAAPDGYKPPLALRKVQAPEVADLENPIDRILAGYFEEHGIARPEPVPDHIFMRRAYLDTVGLLPTPEAVAAFSADQAPDKRAKLVRTLLDDQRGYAEHWMTFWNDALRNDFKGTGYIDGGRKQITAWLYDALYNNLPYDDFARQLVDPSEGSEGFINGIVWRGSVAANERPEMQAARSVSQVFLGVNLKCASCHDSFVDHWTLEDSYGMATVFAEEPMELVRCDVPQGETATAKFLWSEIGAFEPESSVDERRAQLAGMVAAEENGFFTRAIVNRLWAEFFGHGLIEPLEQIENEPWHAELHDWLARDLIENGYDVKATIERILTSDVYQWPSVDIEEEDYILRGPAPRRLSAEQFLDALSGVTGVWQEGPLFELPNAPDASEAVQVRAWRVDSNMLTRALGRPSREQVVLRRNESPTTLQAIELSNGAILTNYLRRGAGQLLAEAGSDSKALAQTVYRRMLSRAPSEIELSTAVELLGNPPLQAGLEDLLWVLAMAPEFQFIQ